MQKSKIKLLYLILGGLGILIVVLPIITGNQKIYQSTPTLVGSGCCLLLALNAIYKAIKLK